MREPAVEVIPTRVVRGGVPWSRPVQFARTHAEPAGPILDWSASAWPQSFPGSPPG